MENKDKNNVYCKFTYKCGICGTEYSSVLERAKCEIACAERIEAEAKKAAEEKKKEEQNARKAEVDEAFENLHNLLTTYVEDYGYYTYDDNHKGNFNWPSRLFNYFWD